jgi:hypothetical protein
MVHCGFEPSTVNYTFSSARGFWETIKSTFRGVSGEKGKNVSPPAVTKFVETGIYAKNHESELTRQLREAIDFRGDVTLTLKNGQTHEGYLFNITETTAEFYPKNKSEKACVFIEEILSVEKTGKDTAEGRSWENWVNKFKARKEAAARGEKVEDIEPKPEGL